MQYTDEIPEASVDICIFPGDDCEFTLYEDEGDGYEFEERASSRIRFTWNDSVEELIIGRVEDLFQEC